MLIGEDGGRHSARKQLLAGHLAQIAGDYHQDPSYVRMLVFSGRRGLVYYAPPRTTTSRPHGQTPHTPIADIREDGISNHESRDGEMFMVPILRDVIATQAALMQQQAPIAPDELRIEMLGPRGTCSNCAEALREMTRSYQTALDNALGLGTLRLSLITRWTGPQSEVGPMGTRYGTNNAAPSGGPKIDNAQHWYAPHWKRQRN
jgi:hypothetical protein